MRWARAAVHGALFLLLSGAVSCSLRLTDAARFPAPVVRLDVAPYAQEPEQCGPCALAAVLGFLGKEVSAAELSGRLHASGARGSLTMDLYLEAVRSGLPARQTTGSFGAVTRDLDGGRPPILLVRSPSLSRGTGHFIVATGYSRGPDGLFLLWGDGKVSWMALQDLLPMWERSGFWTLSFSGKGPA